MRNARGHLTFTHEKNTGRMGEKGYPERARAFTCDPSTLASLRPLGDTGDTKALWRARSPRHENNRTEPRHQWTLSRGENGDETLPVPWRVVP